MQKRYTSHDVEAREAIGTQDLKHVLSGGQKMKRMEERGGIMSTVGRSGEGKAG